MMMMIISDEKIIDRFVEIPEGYLLTAEEIAAGQNKEDQDQNKSRKDRPPRMSQEEREYD